MGRKTKKTAGLSGVAALAVASAMEAAEAQPIPVCDEPPVLGADDQAIEAVVAQVDELDAKIASDEAELETATGDRADELREEIATTEMAKADLVDETLVESVQAAGETQSETTADPSAMSDEQLTEALNALEEEAEGDDANGDASLDVGDDITADAGLDPDLRAELEADGLGDLLDGAVPQFDTAETTGGDLDNPLDDLGPDDPTTETDAQGDDAATDAALEEALEEIEAELEEGALDDDGTGEGTDEGDDVDVGFEAAGETPDDGSATSLIARAVRESLPVVKNPEISALVAPPSAVSGRSSRIAPLRELVVATLTTGPASVTALAAQYKTSERDIRLAIDSARQKGHQITRMSRGVFGMGPISAPRVVIQGNPDAARPSA